MVTKIKRDKNDLYSWPIIGFIFKNKKFIDGLRIVVFALFAYAIFFGFFYPAEENIFTAALFWSLFWPFFLVLTLPTFGRLFCGICPHGFMGKYLTKIGRKKKLPKSLENPLIGVITLLIVYWFMIYSFPGFYRNGLYSAIFFFTLTLIAAFFYFNYRDMSYCKTLCPIGAVTRSLSKVSFTWLSTYEDSCSSCKTFDCAKACTYNQQPFNFNKNNSMADCTLCMDCASSCEAVKYEVKKPAFSLFKPLKRAKSFEIWTYIFIIAAATFAMQLHHSLGRSAIFANLPWVKAGVALKEIFPTASIDFVGFSAYLLSLILALLFGAGGLFIASKILKADFKSVFENLGYALAPIMIIGALSHILSFFFYHYYSDLVNGFNQAFFTGFEMVEPLATRRDAWVRIFGVLPYIAVIFSFVIMVKRMKFESASLGQKILAFPFAWGIGALYLSMLVFKIYVFATYGMAMHHGH